MKQAYQSNSILLSLYYTIYIIFSRVLNCSALKISRNGAYTIYFLQLFPNLIDLTFTYIFVMLSFNAIGSPSFTLKTIPISFLIFAPFQFSVDCRHTLCLLPHWLCFHSCVGSTPFPRQWWHRAASLSHSLCQLAGRSSTSGKATSLALAQLQNKQKPVSDCCFFVVCFCHLAGRAQACEYSLELLSSKITSKTCRNLHLLNMSTLY